MNGRTNQNWIERTCGRALALILSFVGLALVLLCATPTWAQTAPSAAKSSAKPAAAAASVPAHRAKSNGVNHEGITVHGWWTVVVKNPDGSVADRRQFENSLVNGATILGNFLAGTGTPGPWSVELDSNSGAIRIDPPNATTLDSQDAQTCSNNPAANVCSMNLSVAPTASGVTLSGSATLPTSSVPYGLGLVKTLVGMCSTGNLAPSACVQNAATNENQEFTSRNLDGQNGDPQGVTVNPGQTVSVTVDISFSSGS